jgi:hypothetical protein
LPRPPPFHLTRVNHLRGRLPTRGFQAPTQFLPRPLPIGRLRAFALAPDLDPRMRMAEPNSRARLVDILPSGTGAPDETLLNDGGVNPEGTEPGVDLWW